MPDGADAREALCQSFRRLIDKGYIRDLDPDSDSIPVAVDRGEAVPVRNVLIAMGRTVSRKEIDRRFAR
jgi:hypothetical protein